MIELQIPGSFKCAEINRRFIYDGVVLHHYATYYFTFFNASDAVLCKLIYL